MYSSNNPCPACVAGLTPLARISASARKSRLPILAVAALFLTGFATLASAGTPVNLINTVAGGALPSSSATALDLPGPSAIAQDASGNIYVAAPFSYYVYKITSGGVVSILAGQGISGFAGDGGQATSALLSSPSALAVDGQGNVYIADMNRVREVTTNGVINTIAGGGSNGKICTPSWGVCGDGGPAVSSQLSGPQGLFIDKNENVYISDTGDNRIRCIIVNAGGCPGGSTTTVGDIVSLAGTGHICDGPTEGCGDNGPATGQYAKLDMQVGVVLDASGDIVIADTRDQRIRCVIEVSGGCMGSTKAVGDIVTIAGTGQYCVNPTNPCGDGLPPIQAHFLNPSGIGYDGSGNLYIADQLDNRIRVITTGSGAIVTTLAGDGAQGFSGDGGAAKSAELDMPYAITVNAAGTFWFADQGNQRIRQVLSGNISTIAGGASGGDGAAASSAILANPLGVSWDTTGTNYYIADTANNRIREVSTGSGIITTVAGTGSAGYCGQGEIQGSCSPYYIGDGGPALNAFLTSPNAVVADSSGNLYIADTGIYAVREVVAGTGVINTIAGSPGSQCLPSNGTCGDNGPGTSAQLVDPSSLALDGKGNLYIADFYGNRIRALNLSSQTITTVAGTGVRGNTGINGPAVKAEINHPWGIGTDSEGNVYFSDTNNNDVKCVVMVANGCGGSTDAVGTLVAFAFNGKLTFGGDGGLAINGSMTGPLGLGFDPEGNMYVGGGTDSVVQRIDAGTLTLDTVAGNPSKPNNASFCGDGGPATQACLNNTGLSVNNSEYLLIADNGNNRIRQTDMVPVLTVTPNSLTFPATTVGQHSKPQSFTFQNTGSAVQSLGTWSFGGPDPGDFTIYGNTCGATLAPDLKCFVSIVFTPQAKGTRTAYLKNSAFTQRLLVTGTGQ